MAVVVVNTNKAKAPTQKELYEAIISMAKGEETKLSADAIVNFAEKKIEQLANKNSKSSGKKNEEQEIFLDLIRDVLVECSNVNGMQCGAIAKDSRVAEFVWADGKETSPQRVSAMLKKLVDSGDVVKTTDKKVTYFRLA